MNKTSVNDKTENYLMQRQSSCKY